MLRVLEQQERMMQEQHKQQQQVLAMMQEMSRPSSLNASLVEASSAVPLQSMEKLVKRGDGDAFILWQHSLESRLGSRKSWSDRDRITYAVQQMDGEALRWIYTQRYQELEWQAFIDLLRTWFIPEDEGMRLWVKLRKLSQGGRSVLQYSSDLSLCILALQPYGKVAPGQEAAFFVDGLDPQVREKMTGSHNRPLKELTALALQAEDELGKAKRPATRAQVHMVKADPNKLKGGVVVDVAKLQPLTEEIKEDLLRQGKCFRCRQRTTPTHLAAECPFVPEKKKNE